MGNENSKGLFIPVEILQMAGLKPLDKMILAQVICYGDAGCFASNTTLAEWYTGGADRTIQRSINKLIADGWVDDVDPARTKRLLKPTTAILSVVQASNYRQNDPKLPPNCPPTTAKMTPHNKSIVKTKLFRQNSDEFRLSELLLNLILERKPDFKKTDLQSWAKHIDKMIRLDNRKPETIGKVIRWCQADSGHGDWGGWQNNILSTAKLRKQFDRLELAMNKCRPESPEPNYSPPIETAFERKLKADKERKLEEAAINAE